MVLDDCVERIKRGYEFNLKNLEKSLETGKYNQHVIDNRREAKKIQSDYLSFAGATLAMLRHPVMVFKHARYCKPHKDVSCEVDWDKK